MKPLICLPSLLEGREGKWALWVCQPEPENRAKIE